MKLYIVRVYDNEANDTYEYEYGCIEHVQAHISMEKLPYKIFEYSNGDECEINVVQG